MLVGVVFHEADELGFKHSRKKLVLQVHNILHRAVAAFDLALGHGRLDMVRNYALISQVDVEQAHRKASPADNWRL
jgi:hypothetical protein